ncbi:MAG TPA: MarR family transcriptional regulator [Thermoanaerobaculia bacterium]
MFLALCRSGRECLESVIEWHLREATRVHAHRQDRDEKDDLQAVLSGEAGREERRLRVVTHCPALDDHLTREVEQRGQASVFERTPAANRCDQALWRAESLEHPGMNGDAVAAADFDAGGEGDDFAFQRRQGQRFGGLRQLKKRVDELGDGSHGPDEIRNFAQACRGGFERRLTFSGGGVGVVDRIVSVHVFSFRIKVNPVYELVNPGDYHGEVMKNQKEIRDTHVGRLLLELSRDFIDEANERIRKRGFPFVRAAHIAVLAQVDENGTDLSTVIQRLGESKQAVNKIIRRLEGHGILELRVSERDSRARIVKFTPKGRRFLTVALDAVQQVEQSYSDLLGAAEFETMKKRLALLCSKRELL